MAKPIVSEAAEELYEILKPLAYADEALDWPLLTFCEAIAGPLQQVKDYSDWSKVLDIDRSPYEALPWLAQFVGVVSPAKTMAETEAQHEARIREYIRATPGFQRGAPSALIATAQQYLTGTKTVYVRERDTSPYHVTVNTRTSETPDPARVNAALQAAKPAVIQLTHGLVTGWDYFGIDSAYSAYTAVDTDYATYTDLEEGP